MSDFQAAEMLGTDLWRSSPVLPVQGHTQAEAKGSNVIWTMSAQHTLSQQNSER